METMTEPDRRLSSLSQYQYIIARLPQPAVILDVYTNKLTRPLWLGSDEKRLQFNLWPWKNNFSCIF